MVECADTADLVAENHRHRKAEEMGVAGFLPDEVVGDRVLPTGAVHHRARHRHKLHLGP